MTQATLRGVQVWLLSILGLLIAGAAFGATVPLTPEQAQRLLDYGTPGLSVVLVLAIVVPTVLSTAAVFGWLVRRIVSIFDEQTKAAAAERLKGWEAIQTLNASQATALLQLTRSFDALCAELHLRPRAEGE